MCAGYQWSPLRGGLPTPAGEVQAEAGHPRGPGHDHAHHHALPAARGGREQRRFFFQCSGFKLPGWIRIRMWNPDPEPDSEIEQ